MIRSTAVSRSFMPKVKRLKTILDCAQDTQGPPVLWLIDEVFKGTNKPGSASSEAARSSPHSPEETGLGLVTTHDLELADLERQLPGVTNVHFQETVAEGALHFDYRLRPGPCPTTNALRIMALEGLPVEVPVSIPPR